MKKLTHCPLEAELLTDEHGPLLVLTQTDGDRAPMVVKMHPWQIKTILEHFGVMTGDQGAERRIKALERRLRVLRDRIDELGEYLTHDSDHEHADLTFELVHITATASIAAEFCHDLVEGPAA